MSEIPTQMAASNQLGALTNVPMRDRKTNGLKVSVVLQGAPTYIFSTLYRQVHLLGGRLQQPLAGAYSSSYLVKSVNSRKRMCVGNTIIAGERTGGKGRRCGNCLGESAWESGKKLAGHPGYVSNFPGR